MSDSPLLQALRDALAAHQRGELDRAEHGYRTLLQQAPQMTEALFLWALLLRQRGRDEEALPKLREASAQQPAEARYRDALVDLLFALGLSKHQAGASDAAGALYRELLDHQPLHIHALNNWGALLLDAGSPAAALVLFERALDAESTGSAPYHALVWNNAGNAHRALGALPQAIVAYRHAVAAQPDYAEAWNHLGLCQLDCGDFADAAHCFDTALRVQPGHAQAANGRGNLLRRLGDDAAALQSYDLALHSDPHYTQARYNRATLLERMRRVDEAIVELERVIAEWPHAGEPLSVLLHWRRQRCEWDRVEALAQRARELLRDTVATPPSPFALITLADSTRAEQLQVAQRWSAQFAVDRIDAKIHQHDAPIRIGYLSADLHEHATAWLIARVIELHDRTRFHVAAYSYGPDDGGAMRARLRRAFDAFHDVSALSDRQIAEKIAADRIDVLIDLKGYTSHARAGILALHPAPLQVNYLGYPATLGAHADYLIADPFLIPAEHRADYSESIAYLPRCYQPNDNARERWPTPTRAAAELPGSTFVFAAFHQTYKLNPTLWAAWCDILRATDTAVLWLLDTSPAARANLLAEAAKAGVAAERLIFAPKRKHAEHLARLGCADLLLDAFPVNGHTSVSDALWAGLPVLTCAGETFISRVAGSLLHTAGLGELVAHDLAQYRELAVALVVDRQRLARLRVQVTDAIAHGYLYDSAAYTRDWEALLAAMVDRARTGSAPAVLGPF